MRLAHRVLCAVLAEFFLAEARHDDREFVRRQRVGIMKNGRHRQILAADGTVDHDLQALDRREDVDSAPVAAGAIVIEHEHQGISSASFFALAARASSLRRKSG